MAAVVRYPQALPTIPKDFQIEATAGRVPGSFVATVFAATDAVEMAGGDVWPIPGTLAWPTAALAVRVRAGGNVLDDAAGSGARSVTVVGLDQNWQWAVETIATAGVAASAATATTFVRINDAYVEDAGAYGGGNAADVVIEHTDGTELTRIVAGMGQAQASHFSIPADSTAYAGQFTATVSGNTAVSIQVWQRRRGDDTGAPYGAKRLLLSWVGITEEHGEITSDALLLLPANTDVWVTADMGGMGGGMTLRFSYNLLIEANEP